MRPLPPPSPLLLVLLVLASCVLFAGAPSVAWGSSGALIGLGAKCEGFFCTEHQVQLVRFEEGSGSFAELLTVLPKTKNRDLEKLQFRTAVDYAARKVFVLQQTQDDSPWQLTVYNAADASHSVVPINSTSAELGTLQSLDFWPAAGKLVAVNSALQLVTIDPASGACTLSGSISPSDKVAAGGLATLDQSSGTLFVYVLDAGTSPTNYYFSSCSLAAQGAQPCSNTTLSPGFAYSPGGSTGTNVASMRFDATTRQLAALRSELLGESLVLVDPFTGTTDEVWDFRAFTSWSLPFSPGSLTALDSSSAVLYMLMNPSSDSEKGQEENAGVGFPPNQGLVVVAVDLQTKKQVGSSWTSIPSTEPMTGVQLAP